MREFDQSLFRRMSRPWLRREGPLVDLKSRIPCVFGNIDALNEFIRDMVSFANTGRRWGETAYILFGVDNDGRVRHSGIKGQCTTDPLPVDWDDDDPLKFERQQFEIIDRQLHQCVDEYITPILSFDYLAGRLEDNALVSYIEIPPNPTPVHFEVKKATKKGKKPLRRGECWRREGESKVPLKENEKQFLYCFKDVPYVKTQWWRRHLEQLIIELEGSEWEDKPYLPLTCKRNDGRIDLLHNTLRDFLIAPSPHVLLVTGKPGAGKTTVLELLVSEFAEQAMAEVMASEDAQFQRAIPIFLGLGGYAKDNAVPLARRVAENGLDRFGFLRLRERVTTPEKIFRGRTIRFVVCLDALDEMQQSEAEVWEAQNFLDSYPNLKIIVTCRAEALQPQWEKKYLVVEIESLSEEQVVEYLQGKIKTPEEALDFLLSEEDLFQLVSIPLMLEAFAEHWYGLEISVDEIMAQQIEADGETIEYLSASDIATLGGVLDSLLFHLFEHQSGKSPVLGQDIKAIRHMETLSDLARYMDGIRTCVSYRKLVEILESEAHVLTYRNMGILQRQRTHFAFVSELVKVYFAAFGYKLFLEDDEEGIERLCQEVNPDLPFWRKCISILEEITYQDIGPVLALFQS
jgi:hypothetical protein